MRRCLALGLLSLLCGYAVHAQTAPASEPSQTVAPTADKPLPKVDDLIATAKARQSANEELRKSYTCRQTVVADEFDSHGNKKGTHTDEYEVWDVQNVEIHQHVAHDGNPLPPDQAKKEQERVDKEVASVKDGSHKGSRGNVALSVTNLLKVTTFSNERRETVNGRPTIHFDYTGDPDAKASDIGQEVMKKLTGELWLDEEDAAVVRLEGKLKENFHVAGGLLVNVKAGSWFRMNTIHLNGEIWFVEHLQAHADGRFLLFKGFNGDANITFSDYRKMRTGVTILPGSRVIGEDGKPVPEPEPEQPKAPGVPK